MRRLPSWWLVTSFALVSACGKAADKAPNTRPTSPGRRAPRRPAAGPMAIVTVIYNHPKDTAAFEKYYRETSTCRWCRPTRTEIGFVKADLTRFQDNLDGTKPAFYRQAELYFPSMDALKKGIATEGFKKVADDLKQLRRRRAQRIDRGGDQRAGHGRRPTSRWPS